MTDQEMVKGGKVVAIWGAIKEVMTVALKPKFKSGVMFLTLENDKGERLNGLILAQWWRLATDAEIKQGFKGD